MRRSYALPASWSSGSRCYLLREHEAGWPAVAAEPKSRRPRKGMMIGPPSLADRLLWDVKNFILKAMFF